MKMERTRHAYLYPARALPISCAAGAAAAAATAHIMYTSLIIKLFQQTYSAKCACLPACLPACHTTTRWRGGEENYTIALYTLFTNFT
jgi:hypothetical protein